MFAQMGSQLLPGAVLNPRCMGNEDHVITRFQCLQTGLGGVHTTADGAVHLHVVGDEQSVEDEFFPQHLFNQIAGSGGGQQVSQNAREGNVGAHDGRYAFGNEYPVG